MRHENTWPSELKSIQDHTNGHWFEQLELLAATTWFWECRASQALQWFKLLC